MPEFSIFKAEQHSIVCLCHVLLICSSVQLVQLPSSVNNAAINMVVQISFKTLFSILWGINSQVELLYDTVTLFKKFWSYTMLF